MKCPCNGCNDRKMACHGKCFRYSEWKKGLDDTKERPQDKPEFPNKMKKYIWKQMKWKQVSMKILVDEIPMRDGACRWLKKGGDGEK